MMLLPVVLLAASVCRSSAEIDPKVIALLSKVQQLNESWSVVRSLETLGDDSREVFRLGQPVGVKLMEALNAEARTPEQTSTIAEIHKLFQIPDDYNTAVARTMPDGDFEHPTRGREHVFRSMQSLTDVHRKANDKNDLLETIKKELYEILVDPRFLRTPEFFLGFYNIHKPATITMAVKTLDRETWRNLEELDRHYNDMRVVRTELLRLVLVKSMIGNISFPTNPSDYFATPPHDYNEAEPTAKALTKTGRVIADWAREMEIEAEIGIQIAGERRRSLNKTANIVQNALQKQGSLKYTHKGQVVPTGDKNPSFFVAMNNTYFANMTDFFNHISRNYGTETDEIMVNVNSASQEVISFCVFQLSFAMMIFVNAFN